MCKIKYKQGVLHWSFMRIKDLKRTRLTVQQQCFINGIIQGKSRSEAYRQAYPNDTSTPSNIAVSAYRLTQNPHIAARIAAATDYIEESLIGDVKATRIFVLRELFELSKEAKQTGSKIKALELLGKAFDLFNFVEVKEEPISAHQLKLDLSRRLAQLEGV